MSLIFSHRDVCFNIHAEHNNYIVICSSNVTITSQHKSEPHQMNRHQLYNGDHPQITSIGDGSQHAVCSNILLSVKMQKFRIQTATLVRSHNFLKNKTSTIQLLREV